MALLDTKLAQAVKPRTEINELQSLQLTRNLVRIAISEISYIRGLFPERYFLDRYLPALEMKVKKLMPVDSESRRLIDWMEKGVYDALQKKYLETLLFRLCDGEYGPMIEEYAFSFRYDVTSERVSMDITRFNRHGGKGKLMSMDSSDITPAQMKAAACKMIRTLVQLMRTLNNVPEQRTIIMQLYYHADTTPADYEPPFFRSCTYENSKFWVKKPLEMRVGNVNSKHCEVSLQVRSILDPCEDDPDMCIEPEDKVEFSATTGGDAACTSHDFTACAQTPCHDAQHSSPLADMNLGTPTAGGEDAQQVFKDIKAKLYDIVYKYVFIHHRKFCADMMHDFQSVAKFVPAIKERAIGQQSSTFDNLEIMANFSQIPATLLEELGGGLLKDKFMEKVREDKYWVTYFEERKLSCYQLPEDSGLNPVSTPTQGQLSAGQDTAGDEKMRIYEKALTLVLSMRHVTAPKLHSKLGESVSSALVNQLLQRMGEEGYIEITPSSRDVGLRVLRPIQESDDHLQEIVEGVKDVVIAEADNSPEEGSTPDEARAELRTKSRNDFGNSLKKNRELRSKSRCDSSFNPLNAYERRSKQKADLCVMTRSGAASLKDTCVANAGVHEYIERNIRCLPTKNAEDEDSRQKVLSPDDSTKQPQLPKGNTSYNTPEAHEEKGSLPMSSYDVSKYPNTDTYSEKKLDKSHNRIRKASKVEEPIHQSSNSKRMRA